MSKIKYAIIASAYALAMMFAFGLSEGVVSADTDSHDYREAASLDTAAGTTTNLRSVEGTLGCTPAPAHGITCENAESVTSGPTLVTVGVQADASPIFFGRERVAHRIVTGAEHAAAHTDTGTDVSGDPVCPVGGRDDSDNSNTNAGYYRVAEKGETVAVNYDGRSYVRGTSDDWSLYVPLFGSDCQTR